MLWKNGSICITILLQLINEIAIGFKICIIFFFQEKNMLSAIYELQNNGYFLWASHGIVWGVS